MVEKETLLELASEAIMYLLSDRTPLPNENLVDFVKRIRRTRDVPALEDETLAERV